jgi:hypothetical protein
MVGKPNLPVDAEEREASMADEGGASGMTVESERNYRSPGDGEAEVDELAEPGLGFDLLLVGGVFALGALAGVVFTRVFGRD